MPRPRLDHQAGEREEQAAAATGSDTRKDELSSSQTQGTTLTKVTVNLVPRAVTALAMAAEVTKDNRTDVINRALQVYAHIADAIEDGKLIFIQDPKTGDRERLVLL